MGLQLPAGWATAQDASGRRYYVNHNTQETAWEPPTVAPVTTVPASHALPGASAANPVPVVTHQVQTMGPVASSPVACTSPRVVFWVAAGLSWVVWALAVAAAAGDEWFEELDIFKVADEDFMDVCEGYLDDGVCKKFEAFSATQIIATVLCSVAVLLLTVSLFCPTAYRVALTGAGFLIAFSVFQITAVAIVIAVKDDLEDYNFTAGGVSYTFRFDYGDTFGAAVAGFCLGVIDSIILCATSRASGEGLAYFCLANGTCAECCGDGTTPSRDNPAVAQAGIVVQTNPNAAHAPQQQLVLQQQQHVQQVQQQQVQVQQPRDPPPSYNGV